MHRLFAFLVLVLVAPAAWPHGTGHASRTEAVTPATARTGTRDPREYFGDTELLTQDGLKVRFYSDMLSKRVAVVNVMYTTCKDACPLVTARLNEVRRELGEMFGSRVFFVSITSDPERDTPAALKAFAQKHYAEAAGWTFLTGRKDDIQRVLGKLGQQSQDAEDHSTLLFVMDVDAKRMTKVLPHVPAVAIAEQVRRIAVK